MTNRQQVVQCDICDLCSHRKCGANISVNLYRQMDRGEVDIKFKCTRCTTAVEGERSLLDSIIPPPTAESTRLSTEREMSQMTLNRHSVDSLPSRINEATPSSLLMENPGEDPVLEEDPRSILMPHIPFL